jgi:hypothetical protein
MFYRRYNNVLFGIGDAMSIEAMKMALDALDVYREHEPDNIGLADAAIEALRQAIESAEKQEPYGYLWFTHHMERRFTHYKPKEEQRIGDVKPVYTAPVDAVNMKQERVDETAKRKHEPWPSVKCTCGGTIYFKHTKREWVGLTDEEARKFYEKYTNREELIYAIDKFLEEKNT